MSWTHIFTTPEFWTGGLIVGGLGSVGTYITTSASDRRKFAQEDKVQARNEERDDKLRREREEREDNLCRDKEEREDKLRREEILYSAAMEFTNVASDILMNSVDIKGAFNSVRDKFFNRFGIADPNVENKFEHATKVSENTKRIGLPYNNLRLVAPNGVLEAATQLNAAVLVVLQSITEPFAAPVTLKTAGDRLDNFITVFRKEVGQPEYTKSTANLAVASFMETLKKQMDDYMEQAKADMKAAGFRTTPWDSPSDKSATEPEDAVEEPTFVGPTPLVPVRSLNVGEEIALPVARRGTGSLGLISTIQGFNENRTQMTVVVREFGKTVTLNVGPEHQFVRVPAPKAAS